MIHGTGTHGLTPHGTIVVGTTHGITDTEDGMTLGTTADTMEVGTEDGTTHTTVTCILITQDGTEVGTHTGDTITTTSTQDR